MISECAAAKDEFKSLKEECEQLKKQQTTQNCYTEEYFQDDKVKVKYYMGLPNFEILMAVFSFVSSTVQSSSNASLSCF